MISILIPVYNYDITGLVTELHRQGMDLGIPFEIICYDDGSQPEYKVQNQTIGLIEFVKYKEIEKNHGRAAIRNLMAASALYEMLIFIDCDMEICSSSFLQKYLEYEGRGAVVGGITYAENPPKDQEKYLRWLYGVNRESRSAEFRNKTPYGSFMSGNFAINKVDFDLVRFDETIKGYGHEDTLFGSDLGKKNIPVVHIDNCLLHNGLDSSEVFLSKTKNAVENLAQLVQSGKMDPNIRLYKIYRRLKKWGVAWVFRIYFHFGKKILLNNLKSENPKLQNLDLYKLGLLSTKLNME